jgi:unsaturated rhamnogalacturonyl hydrolase
MSNTRRTFLQTAAVIVASAGGGTLRLVARDDAPPAAPVQRDSTAQTQGHFGRGMAGSLGFRQFGAGNTGPHLLVVVDSREPALDQALAAEAVKRHAVWAAALDKGWKLTLVPAIYEPGNPLRKRAEWQPAFPPAGGYYDHADDPNGRYLWRWIGMQSPDLVLVCRPGQESGWWLVGLGKAGIGLLPADGKTKVIDAVGPETLAAALTRNAAADVGTIPAAELRAPAAELPALLESVVAALVRSEKLEHSPARRELAHRRDRSPREVAEQLARIYGHKLDQVAYIPALPLVAKLRLSDVTGNRAHRDEVERIVAPFLNGRGSPVPRSGSEQAGHLLFAELAAGSEGEQRQRWVALCRAAADQALDERGQPLPIVPFHNEMSDAVFMAGPILAATGRLSGERRYFDAAAIHLAAMRGLCLRDDGLYRHSPQCEAAWGRGNGFPALGLAWALSEWPDDHAAKRELIGELQKHLAALKPHQDPLSGCWHQVINRPDSYREYTATCMIGWAMQRGIRRGWLAAEEYQPSVERAWTAIKERTAADGRLVDVCTGTGKQRTLDDYYRRPAILGRDDRGGAMGLMFASEMLQ